MFEGAQASETRGGTMRTHAWPDARMVCFSCGKLRCHGWCGCEEGEE